MSEYTAFTFTTTTAEDQCNYFTGAKQLEINPSVGNNMDLTPGNYRVIDGKLHQIVSDLSPSTIRKDFDNIKNKINS